MNGRASYGFIGNSLGIPSTTISNRLRNLERRYGVRYIAEVDTERLGYFGYFTFVKFRDKRPTLDELRAALGSEPKIQLVALTSGDYDLVIYFLEATHGDVAYDVYALQNLSPLGKYTSEWYTTPDFSGYGFVPLRDAFFDLLVKKVWLKTTEHRRPVGSDILMREYQILKELNSNGAVDFSEIERKCGLGRGAARYTYLKLKENGILKRITITMTSLPIRENIILQLKIDHGKEFEKTRVKLLSEIISQTGHPINKYALEGDIEIPQSVMLVMPTFNELDGHVEEESIQKRIKGITLSRLIITHVLIGSFCYRRFDNTYTNQYRRLVEEYKVLKRAKPTNYDEEAATA